MSLQVSIITVSYNSAETIQETIESVRGQTYPHIEYIVVDGGSTDGTVDILKNDAVIDRWVSESDDGIYDAMNKGIRMSVGEIIGILNSDDWYDPQAVETAVQVLKEKSEAGLVHGAMNVWTEEGDFDTQYGSKDGLAPNYVSPFNHPTCFVRRNVYENIGGFALDLPTAADYDFMIRLLQSDYEDIYVDEVLTNFRKGGVTTQYTYALFGEIWKVLRRNDRSLLTSITALFFRGARNGAVWVIKNTPLNRFKQEIREYLSYHSKSKTR